MNKTLPDVQWSILLNAILLLLFLFIFTPALNSDDDFFFLYTLSGAHGNDPTSNLHYAYGLHPILTWPISALFHLNPGFNWYSLFLLAIHFTSCINLFHSFLLIFKRSRATLVFLIFFLFIETNLLLSFNYSNASLISALSGLFSVLIYYFTKAKSIPTSKAIPVISFILIIISGLLRVHILGLCMALAVWISFFLLPIQYFKAFIIRISLIAVLMVLLILGHFHYNQQKNPGWNKEERMRQSLFYAYNRPGRQFPKQPDSTNLIKASLIQSLFLYDSQFVTAKDITLYNQNVTRVRNGRDRQDFEALYWIFLNNRVYFLLAGILCFFLLLQGSYTVLAKWMVMALLSVVLFLFFFIFYKITWTILFTLFSTIFLSAIFWLTEIKTERKLPVIIGAVLLLLNSLWMSIRLYQDNAINRRQIQFNRHAIRELNAHPDSLFISTGNIFPYGSFYIWDRPVNYPLRNLIYKELVLTNNYKPILQRFNIHDLTEELPVRTNVFLTGKTMPLIKDYYLKAKGREISVEPVGIFEYLNAYKVSEPK